MFRSLIIGILVAGLYIAVMLIIGALHKTSSVVANKPRRIQSFLTSLIPSTVLKVVITFVQRSRYRIEFLNETKGRLVLSDTVSLTSFGFFYPVLVTSQSGGQTLVEVGIESRA